MAKKKTTAKKRTTVATLEARIDEQQEQLKSMCSFVRNHEKILAGIDVLGMRGDVSDTKRDVALLEERRDSSDRCHEIHASQLRNLDDHLCALSNRIHTIEDRLSESWWHRLVRWWKRGQ